MGGRELLYTCCLAGHSYKIKKAGGIVTKDLYPWQGIVTKDLSPRKSWDLDLSPCYKIKKKRGLGLKIFLSPRKKLGLWEEESWQGHSWDWLGTHLVGLWIFLQCCFILGGIWVGYFSLLGLWEEESWQGHSWEPIWWGSFS